MRRRRWAVILSVGATGIGGLVGLKSLNWAWPWTGLTEAYAAETYETQKHATEVYARFEQDHQAVLKDIRAELHALNEKLPAAPPQPPRR